MEETPLPISVNPPMPTLAQPKKKFPLLKLIYLGIFLGVILVVLGLAYFILIAPNSKNKLNNSPPKKASVSAKPKEEDFSVGYVNAVEGLNLRKDSTADSAKILLLPNGTQVQIISREGDWLFVEAQTKGFVSKEFIQESKPTGTVLKTFKDNLSPFSFLYPEVYKVSFAKTDQGFEYSFTGNDSFGGFKVETATGFTTLGNYALKNYPSAKQGPCSIQFATSRKECEELATDGGTLYLLLVDTTLYKISYLKTQGGLLTDINNLIFYSLHFN